MSVFQTLRRNLIGTLTLSQDTVQGSSVFVGLSLSLERTKKFDYGFNSQFQANRNQTYTDVETFARYGMMLDLRDQRNWKVKNSGTSTATLSGSYSCAFQGGGSACGIGEPISPGGGYAIGANLLTNGQRGDVMPLAAYSMQAVSEERDFTATTKELAARPGQGIPIAPVRFISVSGRFVEAGKPVALSAYKLLEGGDEFVSGTGGEFFIENIPPVSAQLKITIDGKKEVTITILKPKKGQDILDVGDVEISSANHV